MRKVRTALGATQQRNGVDKTLRFGGVERSRRRKKGKKGLREPKRVDATRKKKQKKPWGQKKLKNERNPTGMCSATTKGRA